jgi:hypothetical protein
MENRKKLNPDPVTFSIFGEKLRIFFDEDCIRIMGTDAAEILGFANGRNAVARYCPDRIMHPMKTDKGQLIQASAITEEDMEKLLAHAHADSTTLNVLRLLLLMEIQPRYEEYKKSVTKTKRKAVRIPRNNATPTQWKAAKPHVEETLDKPAQRKTGKRSAREKQPYRLWHNEKNPIRRMAKRILSGFPLEDGTPLNALFDLDDAFLAHLTLAAEWDDETCEKYLEALALD